MGEVTDRVEQAIRGLIERGECRPGDRLPSERVLAEEHGASRTTVRLILTKLVAQGVIEAQHGRGYFVRRRRSSRSA